MSYPQLSTSSTNRTNVPSTYKMTDIVSTKLHLGVCPDGVQPEKAGPCLPLPILQETGEPKGRPSEKSSTAFSAHIGEGGPLGTTVPDDLEL